MKIERHAFSTSDLADGHARAWLSITETKLSMTPSPIALTATVSPYMARISGHGIIESLKVRMAHNGKDLSLRIAWPDPNKDDELNDLDQFTDAVSIMFPLSAEASAFSMGSSSDPVNAWLWQATSNQPFDVFAEGYATSTRRPAQDSGLTASCYYEDGEWVVVMQRPLKVATSGAVSFQPGRGTALAFAVWEGSNRERSAQKAVSGEFMEVKIET